MSAVLKLVSSHQSRRFALVTPFWDCFFIGGLAVGLYLLMAITFMRNLPDQMIAVTSSIFRSCLIFRIFWRVISFFTEIFVAKFSVTGAISGRRSSRGGLIGLFAYAYSLKSPFALGYFLNGMYFLVGWHYVKQTFGVMVVANSLREHFLFRVGTTVAQIEYVFNLVTCGRFNEHRTTLDGGIRSPVLFHKSTRMVTNCWVCGCPNHSGRVLSEPDAQVRT